MSGETYEITGQNDDGTWWQIELNGKPVWVTADLVDVSGNAEGVAVVEVAPPPTAQPVAAAAAAAAAPAKSYPPPPVPSATASRSTRTAIAPAPLR